MTHVPKKFKRPFVGSTKGLGLYVSVSISCEQGGPVRSPKVAKVTNFHKRKFCFCGLEPDIVLYNDPSYTLPKSKCFESCGVALTSVDCQSNLVQPHPHSPDEAEGCGTVFCFSFCVLFLNFFCRLFKFDVILMRNDETSVFEGFNLGNHTHYSSLILQSTFDNTLHQQVYTLTLLTQSIFLISWTNSYLFCNTLYFMLIAHSCCMHLHS